VENTLDTRNVAAEYRMARWAEIIEQRASRRESVRQYCKNNGIRENIYYYWQKKLRRQICDGVKASSDQQVPGGWIRLEKSPTCAGGRGIAVEYGGFVINMQPDSDIGLFSEVCKALRDI